MSNFSKPAVVTDDKGRPLEQGDTVDVVRRNMIVKGISARHVSVSDGTDTYVYDTSGLLDSQNVVEFTNVRPAEKPKPEHWPPQEGDMWADETGIEWFISRPAGMMPRLEARTCTGILLRDDAAVGRRLSEGRLIHRKGDAPR